jgi:hypothetical protein
MKILFYGDECREFLGLEPVMRLMTNNHDIGFGSIDQRALTLAQKNNIPLGNPFGNFCDALVVNKMHYGIALGLSEAYAKAGRPVLLIEHAWDSLLHLLDTLWGKPINFFSLFAVNGKQQYELLNNKHGDRIRLTGCPRFDKLVEAPKWDKQKIYEMAGTDDFWLVTIPLQNLSTPDIDRQFFEVLPTILDAKPVYKIHPRYSPEPYMKYGQTVLGDDTLTQDITYELINASKGIVTPFQASFMIVEASILQKPVICFGDMMLTSEIAPEIKPLEEIKKCDITRITSSSEKYAFNAYQQELIDAFPHDGKNSERVVHLIEELLAGNA